MGKIVQAPAHDSPPRPVGQHGVDQAFGGRVRMLRRAQQLTLQQLSERSGLAISTLSKIENGQMSPTYERLLRLADGLRIDVAQLFSQAPRAMTSGRRSVTRHGQGAKLRSAQYEYEMLSADLSHKAFIPLVTSLRAHELAEFPSLVRHAGEEFLYVLSGQVVLHSEAYKPLHLAPGDSCYFDSTMGHACLSAGDVDAVILWVCSRTELSPE